METLTVQVHDASAVGHARRTASDLARSLAFSEVEIGRVALVVTEAANNLIKHGSGGELLLQVPALGSRGIEILALDRGRGIDDVGRAMRDGFSTGGTPGTGLGAIRRNTSFTDLYTRPGSGTALLARIMMMDAAERTDRRVEVGAINVRHPSEDVSGDAFAIAESEESLHIAVIDGLGHGQGAATAARAAIRVFEDEPTAAPGDVIQHMHRALVGTRGAAVAVATVDRARHELRFAGIGNVSCSIVCGSETRSTVSLHGTVGHVVRRVQEFSYACPSDALLVLHSDGVSARWKPDDAPGLMDRSATLIAGVLYRDFARGRDDATVVVVREVKR